MKAVFAAVLALFAYDVALRHGSGVHHIAVAIAAFFHAIGSWVYA